MVLSTANTWTNAISGHMREAEQSIHGRRGEALRLPPANMVRGYAIRCTATLLYSNLVIQRSNSLQRHTSAWYAPIFSDPSHIIMNISEKSHEGRFFTFAESVSVVQRHGYHPSMHSLLAPNPIQIISQHFFTAAKYYSDVSNSLYLFLLDGLLPRATTKYPMFKLFVCLLPDHCRQ
jgi:hypothetical protein